MASVTISGVDIAGVLCTVPGDPLSVSAVGACFEPEEVDRIAKAAGLRYLHRAPKGTTAGDLCASAAQLLLERLDWPPESVDALVMVTQSPDYRLPATACTLQDRLGMSTGCLAFDVNLGCSGYVYGLWLGALMIATGSCRRVLLLAGDVLTPWVSPQDRSLALLLGDAGSATALERGDQCKQISFVLGTDGRGKDHLIVPAGGARWPHDEKSSILHTDESGNVRSAEHLFMNGWEVFNFAIRVVPALVRDTLAQHGWTLDDVERVLFHQPNALILSHLARKMRLAADQMVSNLDRFGNTNSTTIPLLIADSLSREVQTRPVRVLMLGFGVGFSWAGAAMTLGPVQCAEVHQV